MSGAIFALDTFFPNSILASKSLKLLSTPYIPTFPFPWFPFLLPLSIERSFYPPYFTSVVKTCANPQATNLRTLMASS